MDAQLRQRLIGAAVLIALAVIFLPMLLNGPRQVSNEEVSLALPPADSAPQVAGERTVTLPADRLTTLPEPEPDPDAVALVDTATAPPATSMPDPEVSEPPVSVTPVQPEVVEPQPVKPAPPPVVTAPQPPKFDPASAPSGPFFLQLGSYSQSDRADALIAQLAPLGIKASQEGFRSNGKNLFRVRSAGYPSRTAAEAARLKAVGAITGLSASVAESELPSATAPSRVPAAGAPAFAVQMGVFSVEAKAIELRDKLRGAGFSAYIEPVKASTGTAHRVRVGPTVRKPDAETMRDQIKAKLGLVGLVVPHP